MALRSLAEGARPPILLPGTGAARHAQGAAGQTVRCISLVEPEEIVANRKIAGFVASLRQQPLNRNMGQAFMALAPAALEFGMQPIGQLPFYNQDRDDAGTPAFEWSAFRDQVLGFDGVLFFTPQYKRSLPAVLKNALDVGSRPYGKSVWNGKPGAVVSVSPGAIGDFGANHHLRQSLVKRCRRRKPISALPPACSTPTAGSPMKARGPAPPDSCRSLPPGSRPIRPDEARCLAAAPRTADGGAGLSKGGACRFRR